MCEAAFLSVRGPRPTARLGLFAGVGAGQTGSRWPHLSDVLAGALVVGMRGPR